MEHLTRQQFGDVLQITKLSEHSDGELASYFYENSVMDPNGFLQNLTTTSNVTKPKRDESNQIVNKDNQTTLKFGKPSKKTLKMKCINDT
jgi:hypothetical protein